MAKGRALDYSLQYLSGIHSQAFGNLCQSGKRDVDLAALDFTHMGAMNLAVVGKQLLGPAARSTQFAAASPKYFWQRWHGKDFAA